MTIRHMRAVQSSMLSEVGSDSDGNLLVRFTNGKLYRYEGAAAEHLDAMLAAESCGRYLNANVKPSFTGVLVQE